MQIKDQESRRRMKKWEMNFNSYTSKTKFFRLEFSYLLTAIEFILFFLVEEIIILINNVFKFYKRCIF